MTLQDAGSAGAATEQIPRDAWEGFLNQFSEFNADVPVRIEIVGPAETGVGVLAENQPLLDVTLDDEMGVPVILIECGDPAAPAGAGRAPVTLRHVIHEPTALWARNSEPAGWDALEVESADGAVIISLGPHPAGNSPQEGAARELLQAGWRSKSKS